MRFAGTLLLLALTVAAFAADPSGKWKTSFEGQSGPVELLYTFKVDGDKLTGTVASSMGEMEISEGKLEGDTITFAVVRDEFKIVHKGTISGDEMKLQVQAGERTFEMTAKRSAS